MARLLTIQLGVVVVLTMSTTIFAAPYSGGSGTAKDPYKISTVADWQELMTGSVDWDKSFLLTADLDMAGVILTQVGNPGGITFTGVFDGNGHVIRNATINQLDNGHLGLFGRIGSDGSVKNLGLVDTDIQNQYSNVGLLCGINSGTISQCYAAGVATGWGPGGLCGSNSGTISQCYATGSVTGTGNLVGGLCGSNTGTISQCFATGSVVATNLFGMGGRFIGGLCGDNRGTISQSYATGVVMGGDSVGGLVGSNDGMIASCYATGLVKGGSLVGGLVGDNGSGWIRRCYATGVVTGNLVGGLCGRNRNDDSWNFLGCFWDIETSGCTTSHQGGTGKTTAQMKDIQTYLTAGWDFVGETANGTKDVWAIAPEEYPFFSDIVTSVNQIVLTEGQGSEFSVHLLMQLC